jgi:hypothetical protein
MREGGGSAASAIWRCRCSEQVAYRSGEIKRVPERVLLLSSVQAAVRRQAGIYQHTEGGCASCLVAVGLVVERACKQVSSLHAKHESYCHWAAVHTVSRYNIVSFIRCLELWGVLWLALARMAPYTEQQYCCRCCWFSLASKPRPALVVPCCWVLGGTR